MSTEPTPEPLTAEEIDRRITAAEQEVFALCKGPNRPGGRRFRMTVPVESTDSDVVLIDALDAARRMLAERPLATPSSVTPDLREHGGWDEAMPMLDRALNEVWQAAHPDAAQYIAERMYEDGWNIARASVTRTSEPGEKA